MKYKSTGLTKDHRGKQREKLVKIIPTNNT